jgi:hypothetical protein
VEIARLQGLDTLRKMHDAVLRDHAEAHGDSEQEDQAIPQPI